MLRLTPSASLAKEFENYKKETTTQGEKIKKLKESNADAYDVKKQVCEITPLIRNAEL